MTQATSQPAEKPRRWRRRLLWLSPLLLILIAAAIRTATYSVPVHRFVSRGARAAVAGAVHIHSTRSDGRGSPEEIAIAARGAGLRFVVLTDHNLEPPLPRYLRGVLMISGTEITTRDGHLLALDFRGKPPRAGTPAHGVVRRVSEAGGFSIVAHGHDPKAPWKRWDLRRLAGLEVYNAAANARRHLTFPYGSLLAAALSYPLNPDYAMIQLHSRAEKDLARFDQLSAKRKVVGLCGLDAHGLPPYERLLKAIRTYVRVELTGDAARDARQVWKALREGHGWCSLDLLATGAYFTFSARAGATKAEMGDALSTEQPVRFVADLGVRDGREARIRLMRNGKLVVAGRGPRLVHEDRRPGAYRAEVQVPIPTFFGGSHTETAVYSNPIWVRRPRKNPM